MLLPEELISQIPILLSSYLHQRMLILMFIELVELLELENKEFASHFTLRMIKI